jgi:ABC-type dipeptide/oligopeptide/nickel transport system ATPase subunit
LGLISKKNGFRISGDILLNEKILVPGIEKSIQPVFQDPGLYFNRTWTMQKCLEEPFLLKGVNKDIAHKTIASTLKLFSLDDSNLQKSSTNFSGGELQRLSILRAFFYDPEILLMDEPVSGLDRLVLLDTIDFMKKILKEKKITIFIVSHDLEFVEAISNYVYVIHKGKIVESGETNIVMKSPKHDYTKELLVSRDLTGIKKELVVKSRKN